MQLLLLKLDELSRLDCTEARPLLPLLLLKLDELARAALQARRAVLQLLLLKLEPLFDCSCWSSTASPLFGCVNCFRAEGLLLSLLMLDRFCNYFY